MSGNTFTVVTAQIVDREDGGVHVRSDTLPGLILSGPDKKQILDAIPPVITELLGYQGAVVKSIRQATPVEEVMPTPGRYANLQERRYVVELGA